MHNKKCSREKKRNQIWNGVSMTGVYDDNFFVLFNHEMRITNCIIAVIFHFRVSAYTETFSTRYDLLCN